MSLTAEEMALQQQQEKVDLQQQEVVALKQQLQSTTAADNSWVDDDQPQVAGAVGEVATGVQQSDVAAQVQQPSAPISPAAAPSEAPTRTTGVCPPC